MVDTKLAHIPRVLGKTLSITNGDLFSDNHLYYSIVGALQYVTFICPDISFVVNKACLFMANPTSIHWLAVKRILRYLKGTSTHGFLSMRLLLLISIVIQMQTRLLVQIVGTLPPDDTWHVFSSGSPPSGFPQETPGALLLSGLPQGEAHDTYKHNIRTTATLHPDDRHILSGYVCLNHWLK